MERITIRNFRYEDNEFAPHLVDFPLCAALAKLQKYEDTGLSPEDVARMVHDKETGKLKEMPACVGDIVWEIRCNYPHPWNGKRYDNSLTGHTALFKNHPNDLYPAQKICTKSDLKFIGKTVFCTEAEAVAAIEEAVRNA